MKSALVWVRSLLATIGAAIVAGILISVVAFVAWSIPAVTFYAVVYYFDLDRSLTAWSWFYTAWLMLVLAGMFGTRR